MQHDDFYKFCQCPLLAGLSSSELIEIGKMMRSRSFPARARVLAAGEKCSVVYFILSGSVKLLTRYDVSDGQGADDDEEEKEVLVSVLGFGELIGAISVLSGQKQKVSAWTVETTRAVIFQAEDFLLMLEKYPVVSRNLNFHLAQMAQQLLGHSLSLSTLDVPGRLAFQLLRFARQHGEFLPDGSTLITTRLTQNDLAHLCGASREQINRILRVWQRQGLFSKQGKNFLIHNLKSLERMNR